MTKIILQRLTIKNFRNLEDDEYTFEEKSAIAGKNHIGKSNTLEAISFLLNGALLFDCNNLASMKPLSDTKKKVEVEGEFIKVDEYNQVLGTRVFKKVYYENWVKTRGTTIIEMKGHITDFYIDGVQQKTLKDYDQQVNDFFEFQMPRLSASIDVKRAIVDQKYLTEEIDYKLLRSIVIDVAGDVSNEDVMNANPSYQIVREELNSTNGKIDVAIKNQNQKVAQLKKQIDEIVPVVDYLRTINDVKEDELKDAQQKIEEINAQIASLKNGEERNLLAEQIRKQISELNQKLFDVQQKEVEELNKKNKEVNDEINELRKQKDKLSDEKNELIKNQMFLDKNISINETTIELNEKSILSSEQKKKKLADDYRIVKARILSQEELESKCPNCGYILNEQEAENKMQEFETSKQNELDKIVASGFVEKNEIERLKLDNENRQKNLIDLKNDLNEVERKILNCNYKIDEVKNEIDKLQEKVVSYAKSDETERIGQQISQKRKELQEAEEIYKNGTEVKENQISELNKQISQYQSVINNHEHFLKTQKEISMKEAELSRLNKTMSNEEQKSIMLKSFMKTKFEMLDKKVASAFGVRFQLFKDNIKAGSWDETCVPYIIGKDTLYTNGSTSEKIRTNIAIIEAFKKAFNLPNLPIIFDEGESLDSQTVANELVTQSQIICAKVNDDFTKPTVIKLK